MNFSSILKTLTADISFSGIGIETTCDETLKRINRGHTYADTVETVQRTAARGILTGGHVILGLPGESHDDMVSQAGVLSELPLTTLKMHQLQLIRGTRMAYEYEQNPAGFHLFNDVNEYIELCNRLYRTLTTGYCAGALCIPISP